MIKLANKYFNIKSASITVLIGILPMVIGWYIMVGSGWDLSVPLAYGSHDDIWQLMLTKGLLDNGWVLENPYLGAPSVANWHYHSAAQTSSLHSLIMLGISFFVDDAIKVQQFYYILNFSLISCSAYLTSRILKIDTVFSIVVAVLFSCISLRFNAVFYAFLVNYFMVPLAILVVIWSCLGKYTINKKIRYTTISGFFKGLKIKRILFSLLIIILITLSDGYYAFFTILLLGFACIFVAINKRNFKFADSVVPIIFVGLIISINLIMLAPLKEYQNENYDEFFPGGVEDTTLIKHPFEAEVYSSSIKLLMAPILNHQIKVVSDLGQKIVNTSNEARKFNLVSSISLGVVGVICFVFSLVCLGLGRLSVAADSPYTGVNALRILRTMSLASLFILLCSISGGIGTIIALLYPTIRAYERFPLFLIFFVFLCMSFWLTVVLPKRVKNSKKVFILAIMTIIIGIFDQVPLTAKKTIEMEHYKRFLSERELIKDIEESLDYGSMVYQYPFSQYLTDNKYYGWGAFAQMRAYLHSRHIRWSNGASKNSKVDIWHAEVSKLSLEEMFDLITIHGFKGVLIDRVVIDDNELEGIRAVAKRLYNAEIFDDSNAKMAYFSLPEYGFEINYNSDFIVPQNIKITEISNINYSKLPEYIKLDYLKELLSMSKFEGEIIYSFDEYPELFDSQLFELMNITIDKNINKTSLLGGVVCESLIINELNDEIKELEIKVENNSDINWRLNSGKRPISIGYHIYSAELGLIEWDNGYRLNSTAIVKKHNEIVLKLKIEELGIGALDSGNYNIVYELVQDGHSWFGVIPENKVCEIEFVKE